MGRRENSDVSFHLRCTASVLACLSLFGSAPQGHAEPPTGSEQDAQHVETFERRMARGVEAFEAGNYEQALSRFRSAREIADPPTVGYNIGRTLLALRRCEEAAERFERYLQRDALSEAERRKGNERLRQARNSCTPTGTLELACKPKSAAATVAVADRETTCPATMELEVGTYELRISAPGHETYESEVRIRSRQTLRQIVPLQKTQRATSRSSRHRGASSEQTRRFAAQVGGLVVGSGLVALGIGSDWSARGRLEDFQRARRQNDQERLTELRRESRRARTRTAIFYTTGSAIALGAGTWLVVDLLSTSSDTPEAQLRLHLRPNGVAGAIQW